MVSPLDVQRLFLQAVISRKVLSADLAKVLWKQCIEAVNAADDTLRINANGADGWSEFLAGLNKSLDPLDLELSRIRNEVTGKEMYALVNTPPSTCRVELGWVKSGGLRSLRSTARTMRLPVSRATIRRSRSPTSEHWSNRSCLLQIVHTPSPPWPRFAR
ncbi:hypothetical protein F5148DRAFT_488435 [Russula earlei]|uniref:Uncharacterized protein n=1 Tax=Russula earlei TaxID=71964 RepID=A0ACC0UIG1_9AGAM|nr:hypothetical protein F5148DRAFT_488435 [Russula earlei]